MLTSVTSLEMVKSNKMVSLISWSIGCVPDHIVGSYGHEIREVISQPDITSV